MIEDFNNHDEGKREKKHSKKDKKKKKKDKKSKKRSREEAGLDKDFESDDELRKLEEEV